MWLPTDDSQQNSSGGLTLVELLLTITLFSTLLTSVAGLLQSGLRAQLSWGQTVAPYQAVERALDRLAQDVEAAQPLFSTSFVGTSDRIEFARVDMDWVRVVYRIVVDEESGPQLVREEFAIRQPGTLIRQETLMPLASGTFTFGKLDAQQQLIWVDSWEGQKDGLPRLVKFDVALRTEANRFPTQLSRVIRNPAGALPTMESS